MKRSIKDYLKVLLLLWDEAAVIALIMVGVWFFKISIPLPVTIALAFLFGAIIYLIHKAVIPSFRGKQVSGREGMLGLQGKVVQPLRPLGVVSVQGEYWKAKSIDDDLTVDEEVEIIGVDGLTLKVKGKGR